MDLVEATNYFLGEDQGNLVAGAFYYINPKLSELQLLKDRDENNTARVGMTDDGTIYAWQASTILHAPFANKLGIEFVEGSKRQIDDLRTDDIKEAYDDFLKLMHKFYPDIDLSNKMVDDLPKKKKRKMSMDWMKFI
jgi:hypothetical protein